jgi:hypothetical protein
MVAQRLPAARRYIGVAAQKPEVATVEKDQKKPAADFAGLGELGPIGLTVGGDIKVRGYLQIFVVMCFSG